MTTTQIAAVATALVLTRAEKFDARIAVLTKRIAADTASLAAITLESQTAGRLDGVVAGSAIIAKLGRAETTRNVPARVLGVKEDESGSRKFKIQYGEGIDTDVVLIQESQIVEVLIENTAPAAEVVAEVAAVEAAPVAEAVDPAASLAE